MATKRTVFHQEGYAREYDHDRFGGEFGRFLQDREVRLFVSMIEPVPGAVLDVGAGTGKLTIPLLQARRDTTGTDLSGEMIKVAREKAIVGQLAGKFVVADVEHLCYRDRSFDCTVSSRVLMHVGDWNRAIAELCRVTRSCIVIDFPPRLSFAGVDAWLKRRLLRPRPNNPRQPYSTFRVRDVVKEFERHGFAVTVLSRSHVLPTLFHRKLDRPAWSAILEKLAARLGLQRLFGMPVTLKAMRRSPGTGLAGRASRVAE